MTKKIGILRGREDNFPNMLVEAINHKGKGEVAAELAIIGAGRLGEPPPECRQGVVIGMAVGRDETKRQGVVGRRLDVAAGKTAGGVAVDQQRQQGGRIVGLTAPPGIGLFQLAQIGPLDDLDHVVRQVSLG